MRLCSRCASAHGTQRAGAEFLWSFTEIQRQNNEYGYAPDHVDIWFVQECSMNEVAIACNKRKNMGQRWCWNEVNPCGTATMIAAHAAQRLKIKRQISLRHAILLHIIDGKNQYILPNVYLPKSWAPEAEFADAIEEIQRNAETIAAETKCNYLITGGDCSVESWSRRVPAERVLTERAQKIWEFLETLGIQAPQAAPQKCDNKWAHEKKNGGRKHIDGWHVAGCRALNFAAAVYGVPFSADLLEVLATDGGNVNIWL